MGENNLHQIQREILAYLQFTPHSRFSDINYRKLDSKHFNFHLKSLLQKGLVEKLGLEYVLTLKGKSYVSRFDTNLIEVQKQANLGVQVFGKIGDKILVQQRLKQPYYGTYGLLTGKISKGNTPEETVQKVFKKRTGMEAAFKLKEIIHFIDKLEEGLLLEDIYFFVFEAVEITGELKQASRSMKIHLMSKREIKGLKNVHPQLISMINRDSNKGIRYSELSSDGRNY